MKIMTDTGSVILNGTSKLESTEYTIKPESTDPGSESNRRYVKEEDEEE
jgi:hypothetical protein